MQKQWMGGCYNNLFSRGVLDLLLGAAHLSHVLVSVLHVFLNYHMHFSAMHVCDFDFFLAAHFYFAAFAMYNTLTVLAFASKWFWKGRNHGPAIPSDVHLYPTHLLALK